MKLPKWLQWLRSPADRWEEEQRESVNVLYVNSAGTPVRHERSLKTTTTKFDGYGLSAIGIVTGSGGSGSGGSGTSSMFCDHDFRTATKNCRYCGTAHEVVVDDIKFKWRERYSPGWFNPRTGVDTRRHA